MLRGVRDGENGLLAEDTTSDMAARISWALDNTMRLKEIGMAARATIPKPWEDVITEVLSRYEDLIRTTQRIRRCKTRLRVHLKKIHMRLKKNSNCIGSDL
jgi:hypothetical protein